MRQALWLCASVIAITAGCGSAAAEQRSGTTLESLVVTAQKREENVQDVPISIEVVTNKRIEDFHADNFISLQAYVPNLLVQPSPGNNAIFIRGFGSQAANYAFDQSVSLYVDGVYGGRNRQFMAPLFDVQRIEVLRGPQGALFGKNTAAGAVSIVTADPTKTFQGSMTASYSFDRKGTDLYGYVSGPITDALSGRIAAKFTHMGGYIENTFLGTHVPQDRNSSLRLGLRYEPNDKVNVTAKYAYDDFTTLGTAQVRVSPVSPAVLTDVKAAASPFGHEERDDQISNNGSITANFALGDHTLTTVTGYSAFKDHKEVGGSAGAPENWLSIFHEKFEQVSQEVRLLSPTGRRLEYVVGVYADHSTYKLNNPSRYNLFGGVLAGQTHIDFNQRFDTVSVFGQATWHATDELRLLGSLRYTRNSKKATFGEFLDFGIPLAAPRAFSGKLTENTTDPSVTVQYDVMPDVMVYATYGRGSKAGGFVSNTRTLLASQFEFGKEQSENYEVGVKSTFFDHRVQLNATIYDTKFKNLQVSSYDPNTATFITKNAARATSKGVEMNARWLVIEPLTLSASVAYLDAKFDSFPGAACRATTPRPCTSEDLAGVVLPGASKWSGNVEADLVEPLGGGMQFRASAIVTFRSRYFTATDYSPNYGVQGSYSKLDARVEVGPEDGRWSLAVVGKNLTNKFTQSFSYLWPLSTPPTGVQFLDETRNVSIEGRVRF